VLKNSSVCVICGEDGSSWGDADSGFLKCTHCGAVYRSEMPSDSELEKMYSDYYSQSNLNGSSTHMLSNDISIQNHASYIAKIAKPNSRILDFGSGTGELVSTLSNKGFDVDGIEYSKNAIIEANHKYGIKLKSSIDDLDRSGEGYDVILVVEVIEHLCDPVKLMSSLITHLKPGGIIYLTTPNLFGLKARIHKSNWIEAVKPFHLILFNFNVLSSVLKKSGYGDVRNLRFSPLTVSSPAKIIFHRVLQSIGLYGGLRVIARKPSR